MSVIIRLQNLPWAANAADIRTYFTGLSIPEGGVHIVGGEQGDAFIAFSTDEDARQAMQLDGGKLKEVKIKLFLSSRAEMLRVIEQARQQTLSVHNLIHGAATSTVTPVAQPVSLATQSQSAPATATNITATYSVTPKVNDEEDDTKSKDDDNSRDRRDRFRSTSRERGRSRGRDNSRDRSRGRFRDSRRRRDRSRSRDRHRRRSRSRDRRRSSRDRDNKDKDHSRSKKKEIKDSETVEIKESPKAYDESSWEASRDPPKSVPLLPDPPAVPPVLLQIPNVQNGKDSQIAASNASQSTPAVPAINFTNATQERPAFPYNPQMGPMNQAFMQMRGREGWNPAQMVGVMNPMQMGMPRPMMNNMEMGMPPGFPAFGMPMFPPNPNDPTAMWRPPMMQQTPQDVTRKEEEDLCIEIRGLPLNASYKEVKKLFDGLIIPSDGIKMINDTHGNRTGIAYVRFTSANHKNAALNQNGKKVRSNIVEVIHLKDSIYSSAIDNFKPEKEMSVDMDLDNGESTSDSWPRGRERERDSGRDRERERTEKERDRGRNHARNGDPRITSESRLGDPRGHDSRIGDPRGHESRSGDPRGHESRMNNDPRISNDPRLNNDSRINSDPRTNADPRTAKSHLEENKHTDCVLVQGIPLHYNENDIADFFEEFGLVPTNIFLLFDNLGQPTGDAFCQFGSFQEAQKATSKDNERMGRNIISVQFIGKDEMERAMISQQNMQIPHGNAMWGMSQRGIPQMGPSMSRGGMGGPMSGGGMPPMMSGGPMMGGGGPMMSRYRDDDGGRFGGRHDDERPTRWDRPDDRGEDRRFRGRPERRERGAPSRGRGGTRNDPYTSRRGGPPRGMGGSRRGEPSPPPFMDGNSIESFGRPGCVVSLENLHFRAEIDEVIDFFKGFNIEHQNVIRRFDENGRPTGDARVALNSPADALRAVKVLNYKLLRGRAVKVSLLQ